MHPILIKLNSILLLSFSNLIFLTTMEAKDTKTKEQAIETLSSEEALGKPAQSPAWLGQRPPVEGDWVQTLDEDFSGTALDLKLWTPRQPYDVVVHNHIQRYAEENVVVENGNASIKCEKKTGHQYNDPKLEEREYTTGVFTSFGKWTQLYGYMEARVKIPTAKGFWAAFWTMPDRGVGDQKTRTDTHNGGMEVDVLEELSNWGPGRYNIGLHWDGYKEDHKMTYTNKNYYGPTPDDWHVFGVLWEPGKYTFFCDGLKMGEWANERVGSVPSYIICNVEMRGQSTKEIEDGKLPDYYKIDYIKAWQLRPRLNK